MACVPLFFLLFPAPTVLAGEPAAISRELHWAVTKEKFELALERLYLGPRPGRRAAVLLIHGIFLNSRVFDLSDNQGLARHLASDGFDVWNLSLRGTGRSLNPLGGGSLRWSLDDMVERDLPAVLRYLQVESGKSRILCLGYELGGLLLYGYLERKGRSGVAALATIAAPVTFDQPQQEPMKRLLSLERSPTLKKVVLSLNVPFFARLLLPLVPKWESLFYNPENLDEEVKGRLMEEALAEIHPGVLDHLLVAIKRGEFVSERGDFSYRKALGRIDLPLLLIGGAADRLAPPETIRAVHRAVGSKDRTLRIMGADAKGSGYGHVDLLAGKKAKEEVFPLISRWLKQREGRE